MKYNELKMRMLTDKFFEGETTLQEERLLYDFYQQDNIPDDLKPMREMFCDYAVLPSEATEQPAIRHSRFSRQWMVAAAVALLAVGSVVLFHAYMSEPDEECVAYIYGKQVTNEDVVLSEMMATMDVVRSDNHAIVEEQLKDMFDIH